MRPRELLEELSRLPPYQGQLVVEPRRFPARLARYGELERPLPEALRAALAEAGVLARNASCPATGTATDAIAIACPPGASVRFAGPATAVGADIAAAVHRAVLLGALADEASRRERAAG